MNKHLFTLAAGTAVALLAGCYNPNKVVIQRKYKPAPEQPAPVVENVDVSKTAIVETPVAVKSEYEPMTDAIPTGGIDSLDGKRAASKPGKAAAAGTYIVKKGDTLGRIARRHKVRLSALMQANNMDEQSARRLRIGTKLVIPAGGKYSAKPAASKAKANAKISAAPATVGADGKYTIKSGDSPERIARRFKVKLSDLMKANNLDEQAARRLQIGQQLVIPGRAASPVESAPVAVQNPADTVTTQVGEPKKSDEKVSVTIEDVAPVTGNAAEKTTDAVTEISDNNASTGVLLDAVEVKEDTTMTKFAADNNLSVETLRNNNKHLGENLPKGTWVMVPKK